ncbi:hypothetical protein HGRIS_000506 [Hohenbuehelia grisea]|uniref:Uncharacterized protein n=1 Tax=Hohenbuehelia grisea TaxID=104357 RepID=A0ABR3JSM0_9AGAR
MDRENTPTIRMDRNKPRRTQTLLLADDPDNTLQLPSPPSSQFNLLDMDLRSLCGSSLEASRTLISPPPEEILRSQIPFTPSLLANSHGNLSTTKRKRPVISQTSSTSTTVAHSTALNPETTPNPKPRKQTRRHTRTPSVQSVDSDGDIAMESPTRPSARRAQPLRIVSPAFDDEDDLNLGSPRAVSPGASVSPQTTPTGPSRVSHNRAASTSTPTTSRRTSPRASKSLSAKSSPVKPKRVLIQSPHTSNPDADFMLPIALNAESEEPISRRRHSRRSATPIVIPPYEPPKEVFTPPREITLSPPPQSRSSRASRRSLTPRAPSPAASSKNTKGKKASSRASELRNRLKLVVAVKAEPPEVDLSLPPPPASPTDDPILLSGPIEVPSSVERRSTASNELDRCKNLVQKWKQESSPMKSKKGPPPPPQPDFRLHIEAPSSSAAPRVHFAENSSIRHHSPTPTPGPSVGSASKPAQTRFADLPGSSPLPSDSDSDSGGPDDGFYDWNMHNGDDDAMAETSTDMDVHPPVFAFTAEPPVPGADAWSDSDDELGPTNGINSTTGGRNTDEGEGEYTGRWRLLTVPTKNDPPSSATRARIDAWGRPISPFPKVKLIGAKQRRASGATAPSLDADEGNVAHHAEDVEGGALQTKPDVEAARDEGEGEHLEQASEPAPAGAFDFDVSFEAEPDSGSDADEGDGHDGAAGPGEGVNGEGEGRGLPTQEEEVFGREQKEDGLTLDLGVAEEDTEQEEKEGLGVLHEEEPIELEEPELDAEADMDQDSEDNEEKPTYQDLSIPLAEDSDDDDKNSMEVVPEGDAEEPQPAADLRPVEDIDEDQQMQDDSDRAEEDAVARAMSQQPEEEVDVDVDPSVSASTKAGNLYVADDRDAVAGGDTEEEITTDDELVDESLVKITSADPRAAARAAAILKQYDYECFTKIVLHQNRRRSTLSPSVSKIPGTSTDFETPGPRRDQSPAFSDAGSISSRVKSHATVEDIARSARRRGVSAGGVVKAASPSARGRSGSPIVHRGRRSLTPRATAVGDLVYMPGSPVTTLPELLHDAEGELQGERRLSIGSIAGTPAAVVMEGRGERDPFKTPAPRHGSLFRGADQREDLLEASDIPRVSNEACERPWTREDWKQLDACFTDERLEVAVQMGMAADLELAQEQGVLASVDDVLVESVVDRFMALVGGQEEVGKFGDAWSHEKLVCRAKALQKKQRSGKVATSTAGSIYSRTPSPFAFARRASMEVPDFTPMARRSHKDNMPWDPVPFPQQETPRQLSLRPVLPPSTTTGPFQDLPPEKARKLPPTLLAPRYSHLLEEAIIVSEQGSSAGDSGTTQHMADPSELATEEDVSMDEAAVEAPKDKTLGKRVKSFLFSYLPSAPKRGLQPKARPAVSGLPLPPPDVLGKPRTVRTPIRPPAPKYPHPKDQVHLNPAPPLPKPSMVPKRVPPKRLVELHPVTPPPEAPLVIVPRPRRSSGGSVKDLILNFEEMDRSIGKGKGKAGGNLKSMRSFGELKKGAAEAKPVWKP